MVIPYLHTVELYEASVITNRKYSNNMLHIWTEKTLRIVTLREEKDFKSSPCPNGI